jgi:TonB family protein
MRRSMAVAKRWPGCWLYVTAAASLCLAAPCLTAGVYVSTAWAQGTTNFWPSDLVWHVARFIRHPDQGKPCPRREGAVLVHFSTNRGGRVLDVRVAKSSGSQDLDREAVNAVKRASPLPLPSNLASSNIPLRLKFQQPVSYHSGCPK